MNEARMNATNDTAVGDLYKDEQWLRDAYNLERWTVREIADICNVTFPTILRWMERYGIERRDRNWSGRNYQPPRLESDGRGAEFFRSGCDGERKKVYHHQLLAVAWELADPCELFGAGGMDVHHKNEIPWDNREENLKVMSKSEHMSYHAKPQHKRGEL